MKELEDENRGLRMENEFLKKRRGLLRPDAPVSQRCALIEAEKANYKIAWMCVLLGVARSTFYGPAPGSPSLSTSKCFYNRKRLHSTLSYRTPHEALTDHRRAAQAA